MSVRVILNRESRLVEMVRTTISVGLIPTWKMDDDGDITISNPRWRDRAWFHINELPGGEVVFGIVSSRHHIMTNELYGVYHGRLVATLMAYFPEQFASIEITSGISDLDILG